jgi:hypothetical protein
LLAGHGNGGPVHDGAAVVVKVVAASQNREWRVADRAAKRATKLPAKHLQTLIAESHDQLTEEH